MHAGYNWWRPHLLAPCFIRRSACCCLAHRTLLGPVTTGTRPCNRRRALVHTQAVLGIAIEICKNFITQINYNDNYVREGEIQAIAQNTDIIINNQDFLIT